MLDFKIKDKELINNEMQNLYVTNDINTFANNITQYYKKENIIPFINNYLNNEKKNYNTKIKK
jgi:hypothetical protein